MFLVIGLSLITFVIFLASYLKDPRRIVNGFLFNIFLISFTLTIVYMAFTIHNPILLFLVVVFLFLILIVLIFGIYVLIVALFINAKIVMKRESRSPANLLTLFLAIGLIGCLIWSVVMTRIKVSPEVKILLDSFTIIALYYSFNVFNFLMISFIYQFNRPKLNQDFIIVLGSGLIGDRVPPLLASRINKAIEFYHKQAAVRTPPKIIFSGGQGADEKISEALAMQRYAVEKGIPIEDTLLEDKSVNTLQNMEFSKRIMDNLIPDKYNSMFVTNNFHLFRAGIYARKANLNSQGIGSKTALYFLPNAMIREYIAIVVLYKKQHIIIVGLIFIISLILALIQHFLVTPYL